ncbi:hypothetical protein GLW07_02645 [Bacillus hwajinpoensis]|uniref:DUF6418 domain-containing protein n=1 Tax=Guptibacillus hwajinpoensis TaxID=208199 RepID=A0A845EVK4_9BACL|nr:DUF6418 domain-containing protein [Pseudalkalibacillus hwajinpoensis]MYL62248.1 hypothetical protein [Pseudalkalibacillus hwajinpoensis]
MKGVKFVRSALILSLLLICELVYFSFSYSNSYIVLILFLLYMVITYIYDKEFLMKYIYIIFYINTNVFGVFFIETNSFYLNEIDRYASNNNSLLLLVIAHIVFIETMRILNTGSRVKQLDDSFIEFSSKVKVSKVKLLLIMIMIILMLFSLLFLRVIDKPFFIVKLDRFLYKEIYLSSMTENISNSVLYLSPLIGMYLYKTRKFKLTLTTLFLVGIYLFWIGHKFSIFITLGYIIFLPFIWYGSKKILKRVMVGGLISITVLISLVSIQSYIVYNRDFNENLEYLQMRVAQQGQLWWATYGNQRDESNEFEEITDETVNFFSGDIKENNLYNSGIYKVMLNTTPPDIFNRKVGEKNSRYAYSTQASIYYYFKSIGLVIFSVISGVLYYYIVQKLISNVLTLRILPSVLYARLLVIINGMLLQSDFHKLFSYEVLMIILVLLVMKLISVFSTNSISLNNINKNYRKEEVGMRG